MKQDKVRDLIENDHNIRISEQKKLLGKESEAFMEKAQADNKKRKFMYSIRPPNYWNFYENCKDEEKLKHVLRYNAKPAECYRDGRIEKIMTNLEEIGMNLAKHEPFKFNLLRKQTLAIFKDMYEKYVKELENN